MAGSVKKPNHKRKIVKVKVNLSWKNLLLYGLLLLFTIFLFSGFTSSFEPRKSVALSQVIADVKAGKVQKLDVSDTKITVTEKNGQVVDTTKESGESVYTLFKDAGAPLDKTQVNVQDTSTISGWVNLLSSVLPIVLM